MKKQLLIIVALLATTGLYAMQAPRSFAYSQYKFTIPANILGGMKEGEKFVITGVPATTMSELYVKDAQGNAFAKNTYSEYPGGKAGTLTYTVLSTAERQKLQKPVSAPVKTQVMPSAAATVKKAEVKPLLTLRPVLQESKITEVPTTPLKQAEIIKAVESKQIIQEVSPTIAPTRAVKEQAPTELLPTIPTAKELTNDQIVDVMKKIATAIEKNNSLQAISIIKLLFEELPYRALSKQDIDKLLVSKGVYNDIDTALHSFADPKTQVAYFKAYFKNIYPNYSEADIAGEALAKAIENDFYRAAELLFESGATITNAVRERAHAYMLGNNPSDRYERLISKASGKAQPTTTTTTSTAKTLTNDQIIDVLKTQILPAVKNNDFKAIRDNFQKLPTGPMSIQLKDLIVSSGVEAALGNALITAQPITQVVFGKAMIKQENPNLSEEEIIQEMLVRLAGNADLKGKTEALPVLVYLIEQKNAKDPNGRALVKAIQNDFYRAATLLILNKASEINESVKREIELRNGAGDNKYKKLLQGIVVNSILDPQLFL